MTTGNRFLQSKGGGAALGHRLNDAFLGPLRVVGEDEFRQFQRFLDTNAAVAEIAAVALEELRGRGVMEIDVVAVGEDELDVAEGVSGARPLADAHLAALDGIEMRLGEAADGPPVATDEFEALLVEIGRVAPQLGQGFAAGDRGRYIPVRAEFDVLHFGREDRRAGLAGIADDDVHCGLHLELAVAYLVSAQPEFRNIDDDGARRWRQRRPAQPFQRQFKLAHAGRRRPVQLFESGGADDAVGTQAMAFLKGADAVNDNPVVTRRRHAAGRQVAEQHQSLRQGRDSGVRLAGQQFLARQWGKARLPRGIANQFAIAG